MRSKFLASQKAPMMCNDAAPYLGPWPARLSKATKTDVLDKAHGVSVRRKHAFSPSLKATIAERAK